MIRFLHPQVAAGSCEVAAGAGGSRRWRTGRLCLGSGGPGDRAGGSLGTGLWDGLGTGPGDSLQACEQCLGSPAAGIMQKGCQVCLLIHRAGGGRRVSWAGTGRSGEVQKDPALNFRLRVSERLDAMPLGQCLVRLEKMGLGLADALLFIRGNSSFVRIGVSLRKATRDLLQGALLRLV